MLEKMTLVGIADFDNDNFEVFINVAVEIAYETVVLGL